MKIHYNAPVSLSFSLICVVAIILGFISGGTITTLLFSVHSPMQFNDPLAYVRLISYVFGHANFDHLIGNLAFLLLLGPILEEKYSSAIILVLILITALITGILQVLLFPGSLLGASGIVFMFIILSSFTNLRSGEIPLTFVLVVAIYMTRELIGIFKTDQISQFAHLLGGALGSLFGFFLASKKGTVAS